MRPFDAIPAPVLDHASEVRLAQLFTALKLRRVSRDGEAGQ